jgi:hypothetical protein
MSYLQTEKRLIHSHQSGNLPPLSFSLLLFPLSLPPTHLPLPPHLPPGGGGSGGLILGDRQAQARGMLG